MNLMSMLGRCLGTVAVTGCCLANQLSAGTINSTLDYNGIGHGTLLAAPGGAGTVFDFGPATDVQVTVTSSLDKGTSGGPGFGGNGNHAGVAVFDSTLTGTSDVDLQVNRGNLLYLQHDGKPALSNGVFTNPDDDAGGGSITWTFSGSVPVTLESIVLADVDHRGDVDLLLKDFSGNTRWFSAPEFWTGEGALTNEPGGSGLLRFDTLTDQFADQRVDKGSAGPFVAVTGIDSGAFDLTNVSSMTAFLRGSAGVGAITFLSDSPPPPPPNPVPEPSSVAVMGLLAGIAGISATRRRRRSS